MFRSQLEIEASFKRMKWFIYEFELKLISKVISWKEMWYFKIVNKVSSCCFKTITIFSHQACNPGSANWIYLWKVWKWADVKWEDRLELLREEMWAGFSGAVVRGFWHPSSCTLAIKWRWQQWWYFTRVIWRCVGVFLSGCNVSGCVASGSLP